MSKFIILRFSLVSKNWEVVADCESIKKAIKYYDRQRIYHPTAMFVISMIVVQALPFYDH